MGYLKPDITDIDAILTKKGREILSKNPSKFVVTKFALGDDEIDYRLWNPDHSLGSDYYGEVIENMPILESTPDENSILKYKIITLAKYSKHIPIVQLSAYQITLLSAAIAPKGQLHTIIPYTNYPNANSTLGYTAILSNTDIADIRVTPGYELGDKYLISESEQAYLDSLYRKLEELKEGLSRTAYPTTRTSIGQPTSTTRTSTTRTSRTTSVGETRTPRTTVSTTDSGIIREYENFIKSEEVRLRESATFDTPIGDVSSKTLVGHRFDVSAKYITSTRYGTVTIYGNEVGGMAVLNFTISYRDRDDGR